MDSALGPPRQHGGDILIRLSFLKIAWTNSVNLINEMIVVMDSGERRVR
jgi:hypothetical protein